MVRGLLLFYLALFVFVPVASSQNYDGEYYYSRSLIYVFKRGENPCYGCNETVSMIEDVYNEYYKDKYFLYVVDYLDNDPDNYTGIYNLTQPLEVVMVKIVEDASEGYKKILNLQDDISDVVSFQLDLRADIDNFLGN